MVRIRLTLEQKWALAIENAPGWMAIVMVRKLNNNDDAASSTDEFVIVATEWLTNCFMHRARESMDATLPLWLDKIKDAKDREANWAKRYPGACKICASYAQKMFSDTFWMGIDAQVHHCRLSYKKSLLMLQMWHNDAMGDAMPLVVVEVPVPLNDSLTVCLNAAELDDASAMYAAMPRFNYIKLTTTKRMAIKHFENDYADMLRDVLAFRMSRQIAASSESRREDFGVGLY